MAKQIAKSRVVDAYRKKACNVSATCQSLGISRNTFYDWIKKDSALRAEIEAVDESLIDNVESRLLSLINDDNLTAIIFFLKTKAKKRGYVESHNMQHTGEHGGPIEVRKVRKEGFSWLEDPNVESTDDDE